MGYKSNEHFSKAKSELVGVKNHNEVKRTNVPGIIRPHNANTECQLWSTITCIIATKYMIEG